MTASQRRRRGLLLLVLAVTVIVGLILWIGSCGGDDVDATAAAGASWSERAEGYCGDGIQEMTALTLPATAPQVAADAGARIQIVATVRDGIYTLGEPADLDPALAAVYVAGLNDDLDELAKIREVARTGGDYQTLNSQFDESADATASQLGLSDCAAFSQAIARTP